MAILLSVSVCAKTNGDAITVSESENGRTVTLKNGQFLVVKLMSQLGTGYGWQVSSFDRTKLQQVGEVEVGPSKGIGAPQSETFRFQAVAPGSSQLELQYRRPWEKDKEGAKIFRVTVHTE